MASRKSTIIYGTQQRRRVRLIYPVILFLYLVTAVLLLNGCSEAGKNPEEKAPTKATEEEKFPLDARLLSEAVIELNISRRSVGLYPPGHSFITSAIDRAFDLLQKLFQR